MVENLGNDILHVYTKLKDASACATHVVVGEDACVSWRSGSRHGLQVVSSGAGREAGPRGNACWAVCLLGRRAVNLLRDTFRLREAMRRGLRNGHACWVVEFNGPKGYIYMCVVYA